MHFVFVTFPSIFEQKGNKRDRAECTSPFDLCFIKKSIDVRLDLLRPYCVIMGFSQYFSILSALECT